MEEAEVVGLPDDTLTDLKYVIEYVNDSDIGISREDFRCILHNFAVPFISKGGFQRELTNYNLDPKKPYYTEQEVIDMVTKIWNTTGKTDEAVDCFRVFDKQ